MCLSTFVTDRSQLRNSLTTSVSLLCWICSNCCFWSFLIFFGVSCFGLQYFQSRPIWLLPKNGCAQHSVSCIFDIVLLQISTSAVSPWPVWSYVSVQRSTVLPKRAGLRSSGVRNIDHRVIWLRLPLLFSWHHLTRLPLCNVSGRWRKCISRDRIRHAHKLRNLGH